MQADSTLGIEEQRFPGADWRQPQFIVLVFQFLLDFLIAMVELRFPSFFRRRASGFGYFSTYLLYYVVNL